MRRLLLTGLLVAGVLSDLPRGDTVAYYTGAVSRGSNQFTTGIVSLTTGVAVGDTLTMTNLVPGDSFTARLQINATGSTLDLRYAMTTTTSGSATLASTLQLTVRTKTSNPCTNQDGTILYGPGNLSSAAIGNPSGGSQAGDRTLVGGANEDLCFTVTMPSTAPLSVQGTTTGATFSFKAEQVPNN
jgi:hypothetical protein